MIQAMQEGIAVDWNALKDDDKGCQVQLPTSRMLRVVLVHNRLDERSFQAYGFPVIHHFSQCSALKKEGERLAPQEPQVVIPAESGFKVTIYRGRAELKVYYDKPLEPCQECLQKLESP